MLIKHYYTGLFGILITSLLLSVSAPLSQYLRPFYSSCGQYLALLGVLSNNTTQHCGLYVSLSTTLAVATSPLHYRLSQKLLYHRITIQELQVCVFVWKLDFLCDIYINGSITNKKKKEKSRCKSLL